MATTLYPNLTNLTDPGLQVAYVDGLTSSTEDLGLFDIRITSLGTIKHRGYNPAPGYVVSSEVNTIATQDIEEAYGATWDHAEYENGLAMSRKAKLTTSMEVQLEWLSSMGAAGFQHVADSLYDLFNNHVTTVGGDGKALVATDHPSPVGDQSNRGASGMDTSAIEAADRALRNTQTAAGMKGEYAGDTVLCGTTLRSTLHQALGSEFLSSNLQRSIVSTLPLRGLVSRYIDSASAWWVVDSRMSRRSLICYVLQGFDPVVVERHPDDHTYRVTDKFIRAVNFAGWRGIYGTP